MLRTNKCLQTDIRTEAYRNTTSHKNWKSDANGQLSCDTAPEISQPASVYAVRIRLYAPNWKCLPRYYIFDYWILYLFQFLI